MKISILLVFISFIISNAFSQNVGIGTAIPNASAQLELKSSDKGILIPRTSSSSRNAIQNPAKGLLVYDTTTSSFWFYKGNNWFELSSGNNDWKTTGNAGTDPATNFVGTMDNQPLRLRLNNKWIGEFNSTTRNFLLGDSAGINLYGTSKGNIAIGSGALKTHQFATGVIAIGDSSLYTANQTATQNTAVGYRTLYATTTGQTCTAVGYLALTSNGIGSGNSAFGASALANAGFFGAFNTAVGFSAMQNGGGSNNCAFGTFALGNYQGGDHNIAIGPSAMQSGQSGSYNIAMGDNAMRLNNWGYSNLAIGHVALYNNYFGSKNVAFGDSTLVVNTTGNSNTGLGYGADVLHSNLNFATAVGSKATVNCSNCMALGGDDPASRTRIGINNANPITDLHIIQQTDAGGDKVRGIRLQRSFNTNHWRTMIDPSNNYIFEYNDNLYSYVDPVSGDFHTSSDARLKKDIIPFNSVLEKVLQLQPKTFHYTVNKETDPITDGFLAQDVQKIFPELVSEREGGYLGMAYSKFGVIAIKAIQEQQVQIEEQQKENASLKTMLLEMQKRIKVLENARK